MTVLRAKFEKLLGRLAAAVVLVVLLPTLVTIGMLLQANSDQPVLLEDEVVRQDPAGVGRIRIHRFRTTGGGNRTFRVLGRFVRSFGYDDIPALWDVLRGRVGLVELYRLSGR